MDRTAQANEAALARVRIVLVGTTHPGNIGASARAMKAMGLSALHLVAPAHFPAAEATARAAGADDVLGAATVHAELDTALAGCELVLGTTARTRRIAWPTLTPRAAAERIAAAAAPVALVFGRERSGLTNTELDRCQLAVHIPTSSAYGSLNLAQAVQILVYEVRLACQAAAAVRPPRGRAAADAPASAAALADLRAHWLRVMVAVEYYDPAQPRLLERRLQRLLARAALRHSEVQILRGFLSAIEARLAAGKDGFPLARE